MINSFVTRSSDRSKKNTVFSSKRTPATDVERAPIQGVTSLTNGTGVSWFLWRKLTVNLPLLFRLRCAQR